MSAPSALEEGYWCEVAVALRAMVAPGVVMAAALAAALTLTGASTQCLRRTDAACPSCQIRLQAAQPAASAAL